MEYNVKKSVIIARTTVAVHVIEIYLCVLCSVRMIYFLLA